MFGLEIFFLAAVLAATPPTIMSIPDFADINLALSAVPCLVPKPLESSYTLIQGTFGGNIVANTSTVNLPIVLAHPDEHGCEPLDIFCPDGCVILALRGKCSFVEKALSLRSNITNATVLVVYNDAPDVPTQMLGQNERPSLLPDVPAYFLAFDGGDAIASALRENVSVYAEFDATGPLAPSEFTALRSIAATMKVLPCDGTPPGSCVDCSIAACSWSDARPWTDLLNSSNTLDPCLYRIAGTQCRHGHIVSLLFPFPLNGSLPLAIHDLPYLEHIAFAPGGISEVGCIFQNLTKLKVVDLKANYLSEFPGCSMTPYLEELYLTDNYLVEISPLIASASNLKRFDIDNNNVEFVPPELGSLPNLASLNLDSNLLTDLEPAIGALAGLTSLSARFNSLTNVPTEILGMTSLLSLKLDGNSITSIAFPFPLTNLSTLTLSNNNLSAIPALLTQMSSIQTIHLGKNQITGPAPNFHDFRSIVTLNLNDNAFTGALPSLNNASALQQLWLHNNNFNGPLPQSWEALVSVKELRLQRNKITTPVHIMRSMTQLTFVDLSYNNLSLPSYIEYTSPTDAGALIFASFPATIRYVNMAYNNIAGTVDGSWFGVQRGLQTVNVSHNRIESALDVHELPNLQVLDFSYNALTAADENMPESPDLRLIAYNGNPGLKLSTSYLPFWLTEEQPEVLYPSLSLLCLSINTVPGVTRSNFQILLDPAFSHSQFCECIPGTYGKPPSCLYIPDYYEVNGSITDQLFGERRQVAGVDIVFGPPVIPAGPPIRTFWIELAIGPDFAEFTDLLEVFAGDKTLKGQRLLTIRGTDQITDDFLRQAVSGADAFSLMQLASRNVSGYSWTVLMLELYVPYAVIHFQSRKEAGAHFNATFSHSTNCPTYMVPSESVTTCVHSSQVFAVSTATQGILYFLVALGAVCILTTMAVFTKFKASRVVRASSYLFSMLTLTSLLVFLFGSLLYAAPPEEAYECHLRVWFTFLPLVCLLSFFLTKINRVRTIFTATKLKTDVRHLKSSRMLRFCFYIAGTMTLWLIVLSALPVVTLEKNLHHTTSSTGSFDLVLTECVSTGEPLFSVWCTVTALYICLILMWGIYNAWRIRNTPSAFNESSLILASLLGVSILATLCALFLLLLPLDPNLVIVVWGLGQVILALFLFGTLYGPKLWALTRKETSMPNNGSGSTSNLGSPSMLRLPNSFSTDTSEMTGPPRSELEMVTERLDAAEKALKLQRQMYEKIFREWGWTGELP